MSADMDDLAGRDAPELLPCPFCGCEPRMLRFHLGNAADIVGVVIECMTPNCPSIPISTGDAMVDPIINFTAWNRRATPEALAASPEVAAMLREAEARGMERAAEIADRHLSKVEINEPLWHEGQDWAAESIALAIRAEAAAIKGEAK